MARELFTKIYTRINWRNRSEAMTTALGATLLNRMDYTMDETDSRIAALDVLKAEESEVLQMVKEWSMDEETGIITVTKKNGEKIMFDLNIEKIPVSFTLSSKGVLTMTTDDGTKFTANIGSMIPVLTFKASDTVSVTVEGTGTNKTYSFSVKEGSIKDKHLQPSYLADIKVQAQAAQTEADRAKAEADRAKTEADRAKTTADGNWEELESEYIKDIQQFKDVQEDTYNTWFQAMKDQLTNDAAGHLQNQIGNLADLSTAEKGSLTEAINEVNRQNGKEINGYVSKGKDNPNSVWSTDEKGNPAWRKIAEVDDNGIKLTNPSNVTLTNQDEAVLIKWTDPADLALNGSMIAQWDGTVVIRKADSKPENRFDGVIVVDSKTRDKYKSNGFTDNGLTNGVTYYYGIFPYTKDKAYNYSYTTSITPSRIYPSAPTGITVAFGNKEMTVSYTKPSDATEIKIAYGTAEPVVTDTITGTVVNATASPCRITGLKNDILYYVKVISKNAKGRLKASQAYTVTPRGVKIVTWAGGTDAEIAAMLEAHYAGEINISDFWAVGDERTISLSAMGTWNDGESNISGESHSAQQVKFVIVGFDHDNLVTAVNGHTKAAVSVHMKEPLSEAGAIDKSYKTATTYTKTWSTCRRRVNWINSIFKGSLPSGIQALIKTVRKETYPVIVADAENYGEKETTQDDCYLLSKDEVGKGNANGTNKEGETYEYYQTESHRVKNTEYWIRTPRKAGMNRHNWSSITVTGGLLTYGIPASSNIGIAVGFSI